jgi:hypothetical protein
MTTHATKEVANAVGGNDGAAVSSPPLSLHDKICEITGKIHVKPTGQTQQGKPAFSIGDVEAEVGKLCAEYGIVTRWSMVSLESYQQATKEGEMRMWLGSMLVKVIDAASGESFEDPWIEIGTNPAAAASFNRKGYYKALFHIAEEADEAKGETAQGGNTVGDVVRRTFAPTSSPQAAQSGTTPSGGRGKVPCALCAADDMKNKKGYPAVFWPDRNDCDGVTPAGVALHHPLIEPGLHRALSGVGAAVSAEADRVPIELYDDGSSVMS